MHNYMEFAVKAKDSNGKWYEGYFFHHEDATDCFKEDYDRLALAGKDPRHDSLLIEKQGDWGLPNTLRKVEDIDMTTLCMRSPYVVVSEDALGRKDVVRLYENDIVSVDIDSTTSYNGVIRFGEYATVGELEAYNYGWYIDWEDTKMKFALRPELGFWCKKGWLTVQGNSFD